MDRSEDSLARAERHVREGEEWVARQAAVIEELKRDGHRREAGEARRVLATPEWRTLGKRPVAAPMLLSLSSARC